MPRYAEGTTVSHYQTLDEIQKLLRKHGCNDFGHFTTNGIACVMFRYDQIPYKMTVPLPDINDDEFRLTPPKKWARSEAEQEKAHDQEVKRRWRSMALVIKAKLVAVTEGVVTFEDEFLAYAVIGDGRTIGQHARPLLERAKEGGALPMALALPGGNS